MENAKGILVCFKFYGFGEFPWQKLDVDYLSLI